jgi:hypothetical protein
LAYSLYGTASAGSEIPYKRQKDFKYSEKLFFAFASMEQNSRVFLKVGYLLIKENVFLSREREGVQNLPFVMSVSDRRQHFKRQTIFMSLLL